MIVANLSQSSIYDRIKFPGVQCTAIAGAAIVKMQLPNEHLDNWTATTLDQIITQGDYFYFQCIRLEKKRIEEKEKKVFIPRYLTAFELTDHSPVVLFNKRTAVRVEESKFYCLRSHTEITKTLIDFFSTSEEFPNESGIVICNQFSRAIFKNDNYFYLFDSHPIVNKTGVMTKSIDSAYAALFRFESPVELASKLWQIVGPSCNSSNIELNQFEVYPVTISTISNKYDDPYDLFRDESDCDAQSEMQIIDDCSVKHDEVIDNETYDYNSSPLSPCQSHSSDSSVTLSAHSVAYSSDSSNIESSIDLNFQCSTYSDF